MKATSDPITHQQAIDIYFGGLSTMAKQKPPFTCAKCGKREYRIKKGEDRYHPIASITDAFRHIRKDHEVTFKK